MRFLTRLLLPAVVIAAGVLGAVKLYRTGPKAKRRTPAPQVTLVEVEPAVRGDKRVVVQVMGTVIPAREIALQAEVGGRVVEVSENFVPGGLLREGETLLQIEPRDYELIVDQRQSELARARRDYKLEEGRREIAKREWELHSKGGNASETDTELALREPQLAAAKAALDAAQASLEQARMNLARTTLKAPFDAVIRETSADLGAQVAPQTPIATLAGTRGCWVKASVGVDRLKWLNIPRAGAGGGSPAVVRLVVGDETVAEREGRLFRLLGDIESQGRMAQILVEVDDPLALSSTGKPEGALLLGSFVHVDIEGSRLQGVFAVGREAIRDGRFVWLMSNKGTLVIRKVDIAWRGRETIFVGGGLQEGDRIVTSGIAAPVEGMALVTEEELEAERAKGAARDGASAGRQPAADTTGRSREQQK